MAEASSNPEPGPSTRVTVANFDVPSLLSLLRSPASSELARNLAKVDSFSSTINKLEWWQKYENELPHWSAACKLVQPSSAGVERVFSLMSNSFFR